MEPHLSDRNVTIQALRTPTKKEISSALNPVMVILSKTGKARYWYGLLALCGIKPQYEADLQRVSDPTEKVLNLWYEKDPEHSTIQQLLLFLEEIDRFDIIEDITELIDEDIKIYNENPKEIRRPDLSADKDILVSEDVTRLREGLPLEIYDAFLLYDHDDIEFAIQLLETMEKEYGMKFLAKDRDLVGGGLEMEKMIKVITERCNRLVVILSDSFFKSQANQYYLSFAQAYGIEKERKIIPCTYKECTLPADMRYLFILDYKRMMYYNFWGKLKKTIETPNMSVIEKSRVNRSHSDNGQNLRSAIHDSYPNGLKPVAREVKFCSTGNLTELETVENPPLNPSASNDELRSFNDNAKKVKNANWFKKILHKSHIKKGKNKEKRRAEALAN